jgi:hypothetical protein
MPLDDDLRDLRDLLAKIEQELAAHEAAEDQCKQVLSDDKGGIGPAVSLIATTAPPGPVRPSSAPGPTPPSGRRPCAILQPQRGTPTMTADARSASAVLTIMLVLWLVLDLVAALTLAAAWLSG